MKVYRYLFIIILLQSINTCFAQTDVYEGIIRDKDLNMPIQNVSISSSKQVVLSDKEGFFQINVSLMDSLSFSFLGYKEMIVSVNNMEKGINEVYMDRISFQLEEIVINTGYERISENRSVGSFTHLGEELINRSINTNIIDQLQGITNSLSFGYSETRGEPSTSPQLRLRGLSTISGNTEPLIVIDNFPYEGDINSINPNDVSSITLLKDAAAASIWGARAGNGVIIITTKDGVISTKPKFSIVSNTTVISKPDLYYNRNRLPSSDAIELEKILFDRGLYTINDWTAYTPVIEILDGLKNNGINENEANHMLEELKRYNIREQASKFLYQNALKQQYAFNVNGGTQLHRYYVSAGYDRNTESLVGNSFNRISLLSKNDILLTPKLRYSVSMNYLHSENENNGISLNTLSPSGKNEIYPYAQIADKFGNPLSIVRNNRFSYTDRSIERGLLDWHYRPLDELELNENANIKQEFRVNNAFQFQILKELKIEARYQYQMFKTITTNHYPQESYLARDLINRFTQNDGTNPIPKGGILDGSGNTFKAHYGRTQIQYNKDDLENHQINGLAGFEIRQETNKGDASYRIYGYDDEVLTNNNIIDFNRSWPILPRGSSRVSNPISSGRQLIDRFVSYYGNVAYSYKKRYMLSSSIRWDASNIFGVDFNQKGVPLWSIGIGWNIADESFYNLDWLPKLKWRATYGVNGNVNNSLSALPYISYTNNSINGLNSGIISSPGNPELRWERVKTLNLGLDFATNNKHIYGSIEWYKKNASDLIGEDYVDPTTGIIWLGSRYNMSNERNYADLKTAGLDIEVNAKIIDKQFKWTSTILFNVVNNEITKYYKPRNPDMIAFLRGGMAPVVEGKSRDALYTIPWNGLDNTGSPRVLLDGELNNDYNTYFNNLTYDDLLYSGISSAPYFGSLRNEFRWKGIGIGFLITWKAGNHFKRSSIDYNSLFSSGSYHMDYLERWKEAGDEVYTNVPSMPESAFLRRDYAYIFSEVLLERGDNIRLQDLNLSYSLPKALLSNLKIEKVQLFAYAKNLGIIWRANNRKIDPDSRAMYPVPLQLSFGLKLNI